jgi:transposase
MVRKKARNSYSHEFKTSAVKMTLKDGVKVKDVALELGVDAQYLSKWRSEFLASQETEAVESRVDAIVEARRLRDENKRLKMELEILKKAAAYFASQR